MEKEGMSREYDVEVVKMIRNNNMADDRLGNAKEADVYFMLDYFDLLFHKSLKGEDKVYRKFWHIESDTSSAALAYKASYKTLSLYAENDGSAGDVWERAGEGLSMLPFLGVIQIGIVYHIYDKKPEVEETLKQLESEILEKVLDNGKEECQLCYRVYRSSTSSDFCLIVKCNRIETIFKISTMINNMVISYEGNEFNFNTYTNIGIECVQDNKWDFCTFSQEIIELNESCRFVLRFTASSKFVNQKRLDMDGEGKCLLTEQMEGLFGRYDFIVQLTMEEFSRIFPILCKSKMIGNGRKCMDENPDSLVDLLRQGIETGDIQIINERVLVPLMAAGLAANELQGEQDQKTEWIKKDEERLKKVVKLSGEELWNSMNAFEAMEGEFIEERRAFIDICRELREIINTYVPQGMDHDSHVNWQILISDLRVIFACIDDWREFYKTVGSDEKKKGEREHFLSDLRIATEAINQYYKFLQNVNAQTWQSPIYEIQTQLDAEKMMIAYREFLYDYFCTYKKLYGSQPMFYPIIYPDMSSDKVYVQAPFKRRGKTEKKLLTCKVPSFEYYGRMYDMMPWILHEASHSFRTVDRDERNNYLSKAVLHGVFEQAMYKVLNKYSNDFGYHRLGSLEKSILAIIEDCAFLEFVEFCGKEGGEFANLDIYVLQTKLLAFLSIYFDYESLQIEGTESEKSRKEIEKRLLQYLMELDLLEEDSVEEIKSCIAHDDHMREILGRIYHAFFRGKWGKEPPKEYARIVVMDADRLEKELHRQIEEIEQDEEIKIPAQAMQHCRRDYCFTVRQMNRLYSTWTRRGQEGKSKKQEYALWKNCVSDVRKKIDEGLKNDKGFTEIYRILNMIFGSGDVASGADVKRIEEMLNILSLEVYGLVEREVGIYRETCSDIYMAVELDLDAFGYCRQSFQTASDISVENTMEWKDGINVHRFRTTTAVLLGSENPENEFLDEGRIRAEGLFVKGEKYCLSTLECLEKKWVSSICEQKERELVIKFIKLMKDNVELLFEYFQQDGGVGDALEGSALALYAVKGNQEFTEDAEVKKERERLLETYKPIEDKIDKHRHILYRIKYFIYGLSMMGEKENIFVERAEYEEMKKLYLEHKEKRRDAEPNRYCAEVSAYYNNPETAGSMHVERMLSHTIGFIEEYYYRNRFKIMSSSKIKKEVEKVDE